MTDQNNDRPDGAQPETPADSAPKGERIAKVIARAGLASRRVAERMILAGRVTVNGEKVASPALDVQPDDRITVDGRPLDEPQPPRLWLYYKPAGLVTTESDEKGRRTIYDELPDDLPRVITVGRLDLNSEGLLLLTNDGELKRRLELPSTGWLRRYRVRVNGRPTDATFDVLRRGVTIEGEEFQPMEVTLDSSRGDNAWLTVGIREGRNREVRRLMAHVGLIVNRLIRLNYGPFRLSGMKLGEVKEIRRRVLRDQLGPLMPGYEEAETSADSGSDSARPPRRQGGQGGRRAGPGSRPRPSSGPSDRPFSGRSFSGKPSERRGEARPERAPRHGQTHDRDGDAGSAAPRKPRHKGRFQGSGPDRDQAGRGGFRRDASGGAAPGKPRRHSAGPDNPAGDRPRSGKPFGKPSERQGFAPRKGPGGKPGGGGRRFDGKAPQGTSGRRGPPSGPRGPRPGPKGPSRRG